MVTLEAATLPRLSSSCSWLARVLPGPLVLATLVCGGLAVPSSAQDLMTFGTFVGNSSWNRETFVDVVAGPSHTVARRSDGTLVAWGYNASGQCYWPPLPSGVTYVEIATGANHTVARRSDGTVVCWGGAPGQCTDIADGAQLCAGGGK